MQVKSETSPQNVVPSDIIKGSFDKIGSSIQTIINSCLVSGTVPAFLKQAVVLKNPNVDVKCLNNYRPISIWPFLSKVMENVVQTQLLLFFNSTLVFDFKLDSGAFQDGAEYGSHVATSEKTLQFFVCFTCIFVVLCVRCC